MSSFTNHRLPITDHRPFLHSAPAVILAISLLFGCLVGRFTHEQDRAWLSVTMPAISILAMVQPSPLAMGTVGIVAGIALEILRNSFTGEVPELKSKALTFRGKVVGEMPSLYGQSALTVRVSEVCDTKCVPVNYHLRVSIPAREEIVRGSEILMRASLMSNGSRFGPSVIKGRTVTGGWLSTPVALSPVIKGRERLINLLDGYRDNPTSGFLGAISLGERWRVNARTRDVLKKTGTYHLLAISGIHVGAAILPFLLLLRLFASVSQRTRPRAVRAVLLILSVCAVSYYMCFTGLSASALRATIYFILVGSAVLVTRSSSSLASLSWCVLIIVCFSAVQQPDIPLLLSALAVTGIVLSGRGLRGRGGGNLLKGSVQMTMGAVLFTLPVVVWLAGGISTIAPVGNIVAGIPFGLLLIPSAVLMDWAARFPWFPLESIINIWLKVAGLVLGSMAHLADLYFSFQRLSPMGCLAASLAAVTGILVWRRKKYHLGVGIAIFLSILAVSESGHFISEKIGRHDLVINFPRVGQADAAIIRYKDQTVLVDCGPPGLPGRDSPVVKALRKLGVRNIDAVFLSHLHPDHAGGLADILAMWPVEVLYLPDQRDGGKEWENFKGTDHVDAKAQFLQYGDEVNIPSLKFKVFGPERVKMPLEDINRGSMQLLLEVGAFRALFTGDADWDQVWHSLSRINSLDLLKIPHHGSKRGFPPAGMDDAVTGMSRYGGVIAVCPSRPPGRRHLPAPEVVRWFEERGVRFVYSGDNGVKIRYKMGGTTGNSSTVVDNPDRF